MAAIIPLPVRSHQRRQRKLKLDDLLQSGEVFAEQVRPLLDRFVAAFLQRVKQDPAFSEALQVTWLRLIANSCPPGVRVADYLTEDDVMDIRLLEAVWQMTDANRNIASDLNDIGTGRLQLDGGA